MLSDNSILRRLPPGLNRTQSVFLDGIRHSAEIAWLAYVRLENTLTWVVDNTDASPPDGSAYTAAFMDAWSVVDSIDRFRMLWRMLPGVVHTSPPNSELNSFEAISQPIRRLRNVTDHLAQRAEYVAASGHPVLGLLTWITCPSDRDDHVLCCLLAPGTRANGNWTLVNPADGAFVSASNRTGSIHLAAGEHRANLSASIVEMQSRVRQLEAELQEQMRVHGLEGRQAGGDHFLALRVDTIPQDSG